MLTRRILTSLTAVGAAVAPLVSYATTTVATSTHQPIFSSIGDVVNKGCYVVNVLFTGSVIVTIVFVLLAAIKYITKGSDPKEVSAAHQMLIWAAIGFGVAVAASVVPQFVASVLGDRAAGSYHC